MTVNLRRFEELLVLQCFFITNKKTILLHMFKFFNHLTKKSGFILLLPYKIKFSCSILYLLISSISLTRCITRSHVLLGWVFSVAGDFMSNAWLGLITVQFKKPKKFFLGFLCIYLNTLHGIVGILYNYLRIFHHKTNKL